MNLDEQIENEIDEILYELEQKYNIWISYKWDYVEV